jgi:NAD(P)-dependent dehydrogenase (short-subunit alcohol dehydrogenase family)
VSDKPLVVLTGANSGVGFQATKVLAHEGWEVVMVCRDRDRGEQARAQVLGEAPRAAIRLELCDLSSLTQVRELVGRLGDWLDEEGRQVQALVNNAGLYRAQRELTEDGFERTMAVNHLGHFLLTRLLEPRLRRPGVRVVNVSSQGHAMGQLSGETIPKLFRGEGEYDGWRYYGHSKLANVLFTRELHRRWGPDGMEAFAIHPGVLSTGIWDRNRTFAMFLARLAKPLMEKPRVGGESVARLVTDPEVSGDAGGYFKKKSRVAPDPRAQDDALAEVLWELSEDAVGLQA